MEQTKTLKTPIGLIAVTTSMEAVTAIRFCGRDALAEPAKGQCEATFPAMEQALREIEAYFQGTLRQFSVAVAPPGTPFQIAVWQALSAIPYGQRRSYKQIATIVGRPKACRAVGMANNRNPIPIIIPCHRVVGADGKLVGYAGGLEAKKRLLELEDL